ncbi:MAG: hypothetical protein ABI894_03635 [Ilumatobacteraceae bacterium]
MARAKTPVTRNFRSFLKDPLPSEPLIIHFTLEQWDKISEGLPISKRRIGTDAKGMFVVPDPFGGYMGFLACAAGSDEGVACIPEIVRTPGGITFGKGCTCLRGKDPVDPPVVDEVDSCALGFTTAGRLFCSGTCRTGNCQLVRKPSGGGGRLFITCECT